MAAAVNETAPEVCWCGCKNQYEARAEAIPPRFREETHDDVNKTIRRVKHLLWVFAECADQFLPVNSGHEARTLKEPSSSIE